MHIPSRFAAQAAAIQVQGEKIMDLLRRLGCFASVHEQAIFWILAVFYRISMDFTYCFAVFPQAGYMTRPFYSSAFRYAVSFVLYLLLFASLPKKEKGGVIFSIHLQFAYMVAPILTLYAFSDMSSRYTLMIFACILLENLVIFRPLRITEPVRIKGIQNYVTVMLGILIVFSLIIPVLYNGFEGLKAFNFAYIYKMRANASYPPGFGYLLDWIVKAVVPFSFLYFINMKKYRWAFIFAAFQVLFYMLTGSKFVLFVLIPTTFVYFVFKTGHCVKLMYLGLGMGCLIITLAYKLDCFAKTTSLINSIGFWATALVAVRALFIPAGIKSYYYEFFSTQPKLFFSDGQIGRMFGLTYPYKKPSGFVINAFQQGVNQFDRSNSNTGYLGDSYAQMGFAGMLLTSVLLALLLRGLRVYDRKETAPLLAALICIYIIILNDGALFTTLLTGGMLVTYLLIFIYFDKIEKGDSHGIQRL